jgi:anti-sigma B factor antagonist
LFNVPIVVSLITPAGNGQLLPSGSCELLTAWLDPGSGVVGLVGELDASNTAMLGETLEGRIEPAGDLVLNLAELDFMDCSGVRLLVSLAARLDGAGGRLVLLSPRRMVRRLLALTRLDEHPTISIQDSAAGSSGSFAARREIVRLT